MKIVVIKLIAIYLLFHSSNAKITEIKKENAVEHSLKTEVKLSTDDLYLTTFETTTGETFSTPEDLTDTTPNFTTPPVTTTLPPGTTTEPGVPTGSSTDSTWYPTGSSHTRTTEPIDYTKTVEPSTEAIIITKQTDWPDPTWPTPPDTTTWGPTPPPPDIVIESITTTVINSTTIWEFGRKPRTIVSHFSNTTTIIKP